LQAKKTSYFVEDLHCVLALLKKLKFDVPLTISSYIFNLYFDLVESLVDKGLGFNGK